MPRPLHDVAADLGFTPQEIDIWGPDQSKVVPELVDRPRARPGTGKLVLVSAMSPTPAGEGKTTTSIGLSQGLAAIGENVVVCLREPSLGPVFGVKGGGTGGGRSILHPSERINLHFTGDLHAITAAHNLLAAMVDNHLHQGNELGLDPTRVLWRRVMDMNDRALRNLVIGLGGPSHGVPREAAFDITAASEVMAALCLATDPDDLRARLGRLVIGVSLAKQPVTADALGAVGAMMALLRDALRPNLVQTVEGVPAIVHGGPFANIAHGASSVMGTRLGLRSADWVVTEAGFGFDLGAEKFFDIVCRAGGFAPHAVVIVATCRALKYHGGIELPAIHLPDPAAVGAGLDNLRKHVETAQAFGASPVVTINRRDTDTEEEIAVVAAAMASMGVPFAVADPFGSGGPGCTDLARLVVATTPAEAPPLKPLYPLDAPVPDKIEAVAKVAYGASHVELSDQARADLVRIRRLGFQGLPICVAKTPASLSDDPKRRNRPTGFPLRVSEIRLSAGAGFLVVLTGDIVRMPGLPKRPSSLDIDLVGGEITGM